MGAGGQADEARHLGAGVIEVVINHRRIMDPEKRPAVALKIEGVFPFSRRGDESAEGDAEIIFGGAHGQIQASHLAATQRVHCAKLRHPGPVALEEGKFELAVGKRFIGGRRHGGQVIRPRRAGIGPAHLQDARFHLLLQ